MGDVVLDRMRPYLFGRETYPELRTCLLPAGRGHSPSFDHRRRPETLRTAIATALLLPRQHNQPLAARDAGIEKIPLEHGVVLRHDRDDYGRIFRALTFVNGRGIGRHEHVELAKTVGDGPAVKAGDDLARIGVDAINPPCQRAICLFGRLYVLAFSGRADAVRSLLSRQLRFVRPRHKAYWIFIAGQTAETRDEDARRVLASYVRAAEDEAFRRIAQRHLDAGPMPDEADLSAASRATIAAIEKTLGKRRGTSRRHDKLPPLPVRGPGFPL
jgi:hypothetical protein